VDKAKPDRLVDGRKVDLYMAGKVLSWMVTGNTELPPSAGCTKKLRALVTLLQDPVPSNRPLAHQLLDPQFTPTKCMQARNWLFDESTRADRCSDRRVTATPSELIDELESRVYSIDQLHARYTTTRRVVAKMAASVPAQGGLAGTELPSVTAVFSALRDALQALAGGDIEVTDLHAVERPSNAVFF
jgi:hypothetical protein